MSMIEDLGNDTVNIYELVKPSVIVLLMLPHSQTNIPNLTIISRYYRIIQEIPIVSPLDIIPILRQNYLQNLIILGAGYLDANPSYDYYRPTIVEDKQKLLMELVKYEGYVPVFSFVIMPHTIAMRQAIWIAAQVFETLETADILLRSAISLAMGWKKMDIEMQKIILKSSLPDIALSTEIVPQNLSRYVKYSGLKRSDGLQYVKKQQSGGYWRMVVPAENSCFYLQRKIFDDTARRAQKGIGLERDFIIPRVLHIVGTTMANRLASTRWSLLLKKGWTIMTHSLENIETLPREWAILVNANGDMRPDIYSMAILAVYGGFVVNAKMMGTDAIPEWWRRYELVIASCGSRIVDDIIGSVPGYLKNPQEKVNKPWIGRANLMNERMTEMELEKQTVVNKLFFEELRNIITKGKTVSDAIEEVVLTRPDGNYFVIPDDLKCLTKPLILSHEESPLVERRAPIRSHIVTPESIMSSLNNTIIF
jgi:hypothetical protein